MIIEPNELDRDGEPLSDFSGTDGADGAGAAEPDIAGMPDNPDAEPNI
jgi:hypothetical protein